MFACVHVRARARKSKQVNKKNKLLRFSVHSQIPQNPSKLHARARACTQANRALRSSTLWSVYRLRKVIHQVDAVVSGFSFIAKKSINEKCRKSSRLVSFYSVDCRDSCGEVFADLQDYTYTKKKLDEPVLMELQYPCFQLQYLGESYPGKYRSYTLP